MRDLTRFRNVAMELLAFPLNCRNPKSGNPVFPTNRRNSKPIVGKHNIVLALALCANSGRKPPSFDDWSIYLLPEHEPAVLDLRAAPLPSPSASAIAKQFGDALKFSMRLPQVLLEECVSARLFDMSTARDVAMLPIVHHKLAVPKT